MTRQQQIQKELKNKTKEVKVNYREIDYVCHVDNNNQLHEISLCGYYLLEILTDETISKIEDEMIKILELENYNYDEHIN
jgi:hypothetical protein